MLWNFLLLFFIVKLNLELCVTLSHLRPCQNIAKKWFVQNNSPCQLWVLQSGCNPTSWPGLGFAGKCFLLSPPPSPSFLFFALVPTFSMNSRRNACYAGYNYRRLYNKHKLNCKNGLENDTGTQYFPTCRGSQNGHSFCRWVIFKNLNCCLSWILMFDQFY